MRVLAALVSIVLVAGLTGCSQQPSAPTLTVFAAASLKQPFTEIGERFKAANPGVEVKFSFAASSELATQLKQGATADVFASADTEQMDKVAGPGLLAGTPTNFAANSLVIVTAPGNPKGVKSFADLSRPEVKVVVCQAPAPCGTAARHVEDATGIRLHRVSEEPGVTDVLGKVTSGQADAGLVYTTDAMGAGNKVTTVTFPQAASAGNTYPIAVLKNAPQAASAQKFVALVTGPEGQQILERLGFAKP